MTLWNKRVNLIICIGMIGLLLVYGGYLGMLLLPTFLSIIAALIGLFILYFNGIFCGWSDTKENIVIALIIKISNYISCLISFEISILHIANKYDVYTVTLMCIILGIHLFLVSICTSTYGIALIINSDLNLGLKIILSILEHFPILDIINLSILSIYFNNRLKVERRVAEDNAR